MNIIKQVHQFLLDECQKEGAHYGMTAYNHHFVDMVKYSKNLAVKLNADLEIIQIAAWLHDIGSIIEGRDNHHITGAQIAEKKLTEFNYPKEKIEKVKECILNHRGSQEKNNIRNSIEAKIIAEADTLSAFDDITKHFWASMVGEGKGITEARISVKNKLKNKWGQLTLKESKDLIRKKYEAAMILL